MLTDRRVGEDGVAMIAAMALLILGGFVAISIFVSAKSSGDSARARLDASASEQLARDAGAMLVNAYSTVASGEHDGFIPGVAVLTNHATRIGGTVVSNSVLPAELGLVDPRIPVSGRYAVRQSLADGRIGFWQLYSVKLPDWGSTKGGRVVTYVRTWTTGAGGAVTLPAIYRLEFRPTWFADYQMLFDGKQVVGVGAQISGRVHSNGYDSSYYDQYRTMGAQITFEAGATCSSAARISTATGAIAGAGSCRTRANTGIRYNFLRARDMATRLRALCQGPANLRPSVQMACPTTTALTRITLSGTTVNVAGVGTLDARVAGNAPGQNQGAVVITAGDIELRGRLANGARATIVAASPGTSSSYGNAGAPSVWIRSDGDVGASGATTSSFGVVAEGDVIFDEERMNRATARGAFLTMSGMVSSHPTWRSPAPVAGGIVRGGPIRIEGSMTGHYPPILYNQSNRSGFLQRFYTWNDALYDNPPPLFPTAADWEITQMAPANLDCFASGAGGSLQTARPDCA